MNITLILKAKWILVGIISPILIILDLNEKSLPFIFRPSPL